MSIKVIGSGVGRTGTHSLKLGLERLLGAPCYHMVEVFQHPEHVAVWHAAAEGKAVDWPALFAGYSATCDFPSCSFFEQQMAAFPEAIVVHSTRDPEAWYKSASNTIFHSIEMRATIDPAWYEMVMAVLKNTFTLDIKSKEACLAAFNKHNEHVLSVVPADRLVVWKATDGWGPLCKGLGIAVPAEPFPVTNTTEEFQARVRQAQAGAAH